MVEDVTDVEMRELTIEVPSDEWAEQVIEGTHHSSVDGFIAEILEVSAAGAEEAQNVEGVEQDIELPASTVERYQDAMDLYADVDDDPEAVISSIIKAAAATNSHIF